MHDLFESVITWSKAKNVLISKCQKCQKNEQQESFGETRRQKIPPKIIHLYQYDNTRLITIARRPLSAPG